MPKKSVKPFKCGKVTSISISRLYNLGNYQNVKFDISAQIADSDSASQTFINLMWIVNQLAPLRTPDCKHSYEEAVKLPAESQSEYQKAHVKEWADEMAAWSEKKRRRAEAVTMFDTLAGVSKYTDAKQSWGDNDDTPF